MKNPIEAWRTTDKKQTVYGAMEHDGGFCALAVLNPRRPAAMYKARSLARFGISAVGDGTPKKCPIRGCASRAIYPGAVAIMHWNDTHELSFDNIATLAEQHPDLVFIDGKIP